MYARMKRLRHLLLLLLALLACSCGSTKQNTAQSRFWQAFVTRYNVYHNGNEAYKEGLQTQEKGHKDNYLQPIPLYIVSSPTTQKMGSGNFDTAVEKAQKASKLHSIKAKPKKKAGKTLTGKDKQWYARKEASTSAFPVEPWMLSFDEKSAKPGMKGDWNWENGLNRDQIHSPNESYLLSQFFKGMESIALFYKYF